MGNFSWDAARVPQAERFNAFVESVCRPFAQLEPIRLDRHAAFHARIDHREAAGVAVTHLASSNYLSRRTAAAIARSPSQDFFLNYVVAGNMHVSHSGSGTQVCSGGLFMLDNTRPFELSMPPGGAFRSTVVRVGRPPWLERHADRLPDLDQLLRGHHLLPLLTMNLAQLAQGGVAARDDEVEVLAQATCRLLELMCSSQPAQASAQDPGGWFGLVCLEIDRHIGDPEFSLDRLAGRLGISARSIQRVLAQRDQSFSSYLRERRLSTAAAMLRNAMASRSIEGIAAECGFSDLSAFYRSFKRRYGTNPGAWRGM